MDAPEPRTVAAEPTAARLRVAVLSIGSPLFPADAAAATLQPMAAPQLAALRQPAFRPLSRASLLASAWRFIGQPYGWGGSEGGHDHISCARARSGADCSKPRP